MKQLKKGDPCRIRIKSSGEILDAIYDEPFKNLDGHHLVYIGKDLHSVGRYGMATFICPSCDIRPVDRVQEGDNK